MTRIISIINQKGGVGKTTTAQNLTAGLEKKGFKTLLIDLDAQCNLTYSINVDSKYTIYDVFSDKISIKETICNNFIAGSPLLSTIDTILNQTGKEYKLKEALSGIINCFDFIILDTPPALGTITINALTAATEALITAQPDAYSLQGISQLYQTIFAVKKYCNPQLKVCGILLTRYNKRTIISNNATTSIINKAKQLNTKVFDTKIRECTAIKESQVVQKNIFDYSKYSNASFDYQKLVEEILGE